MTGYGSVSRFGHFTNRNIRCTLKNGVPPSVNYLHPGGTKCYSSKQFKTMECLRSDSVLSLILAVATTVKQERCQNVSYKFFDLKMFAVLFQISCA